jgi:hypothetical protein
MRKSAGRSMSYATNQRLEQQLFVSLIQFQQLLILDISWHQACSEKVALTSTHLSIETPRFQVLTVSGKVVVLSSTFMSFPNLKACKWGLDCTHVLHPAPPPSQAPGRALLPLPLLAHLMWMLQYPHSRSGRCCFHRLSVARRNATVTDLFFGFFWPG